MILCARYGGAEADLRFGSGALPGVFIVFLLWRGRFAGKFQPEAFFENVFRFYFFSRLRGCFVTGCKSRE